jgi:hypothetical protein
MELTTFQSVMDSLNRQHVRCLLVGGMAVVAHGYGRMTFDMDLVVQLNRENILRAFKALEAIGYRPRVPVAAEQFADPDTRQRWIHEKGMMVLNFWSDAHRTTMVDVFVEEPFDFDATYAKSIEADVEGVSFRYVDIQTLIRMKEAAGRPNDLDDIRHLRMIADDQG